MKLIHEIADTNFDIQSAYQTLSTTFDLSNLFQNILKMMAYSGVTLKPETITNLSEFTNDPANQKAFIDMYKNFIQGIYTSEHLDTEYPETCEILKVADAYAQQPTLQTVIENAFNLTFSMFDTNELVYVSKTTLGAYYEFTKALYLQHELYKKRSPLKNNGLHPIQVLYEQMYVGPSFDTIPINSNAYIDLAFMIYAYKHYGAFLGVMYIPADYLNEHKNTLDFGNTRGLRVIPLFAYPAVNTNLTLYYDKQIYEFTETKPSHSDVITYTNIKAPNPNAKPIVSCSLSVGNGMDIGYIRGTYKDADGNTIPVATFNGNSMNMEAGFNIPIILMNDEVLATAFDEKYYQQMNTKNQYWHLADNTYLTSYYTSSMKIAQMGLASERMKALIDDNILQIQQYEIIETDTSFSQEIVPNPDYENAYTAGGGIQITDDANNSDLLLTLLSNAEYEAVINGEQTIFEALKKHALYVTSKTDLNTPIVADMGEPFALPEYKDNVNQILYTAIPSTLFDVYILNSFNISALGAQLFDPDVNAALRRIFNDPGQAIISLGFIPFVCDRVTNKEIIIGNYATGIKAYKPLSQYMELDYGVFRFEKLDYLSIEPYADYEIYIPFAGKFPILSSLFSGKTVRLRCLIDILTGDMLTSMYVTENAYSESAYYNRNTQDLPVATFVGNCMRKIPLSTASGIGYLNATAKIGYGAAVLAAGESKIGSNLATIAGQFLPATIAPSIKTVGEMSGNTGYMGVTHPYIIGRRRGVPSHVNGNPIKSYANLGHEVPLSCCHGYTEVMNLQTQFTDANAPILTNKEMNELEEILASGIILP